MSNSLRKIKRNICENKYGVRACTVKGVKKKLRLLEEEIARKTKDAFDRGDDIDEEAAEGGCGS